MPEAFGDGLESRRFGLVPKRVVRIRSVDDPRQKYEGWVLAEAMFLDNGLDRALLAMMTEFDPLHIEGDCSLLRGHGHYLVDRDEQELGLGVHELLDEPGAGHAINLHPLSRHPFHGMSLFLDQCPSWFSQCLS